MQLQQRYRLCISNSNSLIVIVDYNSLFQALAWIVYCSSSSHRVAPQIFLEKSLWLQMRGEKYIPINYYPINNPEWLWQMRSSLALWCMSKDPFPAQLVLVSLSSLSICQDKSTATSRTSLSSPQNYLSQVTVKKNKVTQENKASKGIYRSFISMDEDKAL